MNAATEWTAVTGSWRVGTPQLKEDLHWAVAAELDAGRGIIAGGALGVDFDATDQTLLRYPGGERIRVVIPTPLDIYAAHYERRTREGVITDEQHRLLILQLHCVKTLGCLMEMSFTLVDRDSYYARNSELLRSASRVLAFQVDGSAGTQDAIDKATASGLEVRLFSYRT